MAADKKSASKGGSKTATDKSTTTSSSKNNGTDKSASSSSKKKGTIKKKVTISAEPKSPEDQRGAALKTVYLATFLDSMGTNMVMPLLPFLALRMHASPFGIGLMSSLFSLFQMIGSLVLGTVSDIVGRRAVLLVCLLCSSAALVAFGLAQNFTQLLIFRAASGFFAGTIGVCQALVVDYSPESEVTAGMGKIGSMIGLGWIAGPGIAGLLVGYGFLVVCLCGASLTFLNFVLGIFLLPKPAKDEKQEEIEDDGEKGSMKEFRRIMLQDPRIGLLFLMYCLQQVCVGVVLGISGLFFHDVYGMDARGLGLLYCLAGLIMALAQVLLTKVAVRLLGEMVCVMVGNGLRTFFYMLLASFVAQGLPQVCVVGVITTNALITPCMASTISTLAPEDLRGAVIGTSQAFVSLGNFIGPLVGGAIYAGHMFLPFQLCALISLLNIAMAPFAFRGLREEMEAKADANRMPLLNIEEGLEAPPPRMKQRRASTLELLHTNSFSLPHSLLTPDVGGHHAFKFGSLSPSKPLTRRATIANISSPPAIQRPAFSRRPSV